MSISENMYKGPDITLLFIYKLEKLRRNPLYYLLYKRAMIKFGIEQIIETVAFHIKLITEYERYSKVAYAYPYSRVSNISFYPVDPSIDQVIPERPHPGEFITKSVEYPRRESVAKAKCYCIDGKKICPNCGGSGRIICRKCNGSGVCRKCSGDGYIACPKCGGTGKYTYFGETKICDLCNGTGKVVCSECNGTGKCSFCSGVGYFICPLCKGTGKVICPICEGEGFLLLYVSDIYEYYNVCDQEFVISDKLDIKRNILLKIMNNSRLAINIPSLNVSTVLEFLGNSNKDIIETTYSAKYAHENLLAKAKSREFVRDKVPDNDLKEQVRRKVIQIIENNWESCEKETLSPKFKLKLSDSERQQRTHTIYVRRLFHKSAFNMYPVALLILNNKRRKTFLGVGHDNEYKLESLRIFLSPVKLTLLALILLLVFGHALGIPCNASSILFPLFHMRLQDIMALIFIFAISAYLIIVIDDYTSIKTRLIMLIGSTDLDKIALLTLLVSCVSYYDKGEIIDKIYPIISEMALKGRIYYKSSIACCIVHNNLVSRMISIAQDSLMKHYEQIVEIVKFAENLIILLNTSDVDKVNMYKEIISQFRGKHIILIKTSSCNEINNICRALCEELQKQHKMFYLMDMNPKQAYQEYIAGRKDVLLKMELLVNKLF